MPSEERGAARVRIAVLGRINVGKSALTVRYLTRRFIGEYSSNTDLLYRQSVQVGGALVDVEIFDASGETRDSMTPSEASQLAADGVVVVYSITDRESFRYAQRVLDLLNGVRGLPVTLMANKADLAHLRTVEHCEGRALADGAGASFYEVSVAEDSAGLYQAFELLVGECHAQLCTNNNNNNNGLGEKAGSRTRKFSVTKMLGTLIGAAKGSSPPPSPPSGTAAASGQGTVIVCQKSDLYRTGVLKRRHKTSASASL